MKLLNVTSMRHRVIQLKCMTVNILQNCKKFPIQHSFDSIQRTFSPNAQCILSPNILQFSHKTIFSIAYNPISQCKRPSSPKPINIYNASKRISHNPWVQNSKACREMPKFSQIHIILIVLHTEGIFFMGARVIRGYCHAQELMTLWPPHFPHQARTLVYTPNEMEKN